MEGPLVEPSIIVHGGAGTIPLSQNAEYARGTALAAARGLEVLRQGGSALLAAVTAVVCLEDDPTFNAATGSALTSDGLPQCDAFVMLDDLNAGGVAGVYGVKNPVLLARAVLERSPHVLLCGPGAELFADEQGLERCAPAAQVVPRRLEVWQRLRQLDQQFQGDPEMEDPEGLEGYELEELRGTVGALTLDQRGNMAVASSTGGIMLKLPGRVGDTPLPGAGSYCGPGGAVTCTGHGEAAMRVCLAKYCHDLLEAGRPVLEAAQQAVAYCERRTFGRVGLIAMDRDGRRAYATCTKAIAVGLPGQTLEPLRGSGLF
jgi:beta-aspartyl-peptidase (threonine type)